MAFGSVNLQLDSAATARTHRLDDLVDGLAVAAQTVSVAGAAVAVDGPVVVVVVVPVVVVAFETHIVGFESAGAFVVLWPNTST